MDKRQNFKRHFALLFRALLVTWHNAIQHKSTKNNDTQHKKAQRNNPQLSETRHKGAQHNNTYHNKTLHK